MLFVYLPLDSFLDLGDIRRQGPTGMSLLNYQGDVFGIEGIADS
jgi:hypothetical protein